MKNPKNTFLRNLTGDVHWNFYEADFVIFKSLVLRIQSVCAVFGPPVSFHNPPSVKQHDTSLFHRLGRKQELIRRWDSERELLRSAPRKLPEFDEITQNNAISPFKVIQGHRFWYQSKAHIRFPVSDTNLPHTLHRFRNIAVDRSEIAILGYPSCV